MRLSVLALLLTVTGGAHAAERYLVAPSVDAPARLAPGDELQATVRLRLPLTPPPGVQQPRAWEGWTVRLERAATVGLRGAATSLGYSARLLRIRPAGGELYRLSAKTPLWMPAGRYDLLVAGPGLDARAPGVVIVERGTGPPWRGADDPVHRAAEQTIMMRNPRDQAADVVLELVVPGSGPGLTLWAGDRIVPPIEVTWARTPAGSAPDAPRLLTYAVRVPAAGPAGPGTVELRYAEASAGAKCQLALAWEDAGEVRPMEWQNIAATTGAPSQTVIRDFGDGDWGVGPRVRHRWLFDAAVDLRVSSFDAHGRVCHVARRVALASPTGRAGCGCAMVGAPRAGRAGPRQRSGLVPALAAALVGIFFLSFPRRAE